MKFDCSPSSTHLKKKTFVVAISWPIAWKNPKQQMWSINVFIIHSKWHQLRAARENVSIEIHISSSRPHCYNRILERGAGAIGNRFQYMRLGICGITQQHEHAEINLLRPNAVCDFSKSSDFLTFWFNVFEINRTAFMSWPCAMRLWYNESTAKI